jgi:malate dehydrogenase (oxaloacetate-decarboxylating)
LKKLRDTEHEKYDLAILTNEEQRAGDFGEAMRDADVCISASTPEPGLIKNEWVKSMASDAIVFACANPLPEIWPWEAKAAGARVVGTGRSDFPNQINNSLGFPAIFRGALDVRAKTITDEMCIAAAESLADLAEEKGMKDDCIIPSMHDWELYPREAVAVATMAMEQGVARIQKEPEELLKHARHLIKSSIDVTQLLMDTGFIPKGPI